MVEVWGTCVSVCANNSVLLADHCAVLFYDPNPNFLSPLTYRCTLMFI